MKAKTKKAWKQQNALKKWRKEEEKRIREFRDLVERELGKLGEELDMSQVEMAEQKAAEEYHVREALSHLHGVLGDEVHDLSKTSARRGGRLHPNRSVRLKDMVLRHKHLDSAETSATSV